MHVLGGSAVQWCAAVPSACSVTWLKTGPAKWIFTMETGTHNTSGFPFTPSENRFLSIFQYVLLDAALLSS